MSGKVWRFLFIGSGITFYNHSMQRLSSNVHIYPLAPVATKTSQGNFISRLWVKDSAASLASFLIAATTSSPLASILERIEAAVVDM
jgi:hypothetical protein